jgi:hypothetical protein
MPTSRRRVVIQRKSSPPVAHCKSTVAASRRAMNERLWAATRGKNPGTGPENLKARGSDAVNQVILTVEKGGPLNSYALAFGILGGGVVLAAFLWLLPRFRLRLAVRRFRRALDGIEVVAMLWSQGVRHEPGDDLRATPPEGHRTRRRHDGQSDDGGAALV